MKARSCRLKPREIVCETVQPFAQLLTGYSATGGDLTTNQKKSNPRKDSPLKTGFFARDQSAVCVKESHTPHWRKCRKGSLQDNNFGPNGRTVGVDVRFSSNPLQRRGTKQRVPSHLPAHVQSEVATRAGCQHLIEKLP